MTLALSTCVLYAVRSIQRSHQKSVYSVEQMIVHSDRSGLSKYDGETILGDEARYLINKFTGKAFIRVVSSRSIAGAIEFSQMKNPASDAFVDRTCRYVCKCLYDNNGVCVGIELREDGVLIESNLSPTMINWLHQVRDSLEAEVNS